MDTDMLVTFRTVRPMSDDEFFEFCQINDTLEFERDSHGNIILMSPTGSIGGGFNADVTTALNVWNRQSGLGKVFESSSGFKLPDGSIRSPDVSWIRKERWNAISREEKLKFAPICPDFVIEIRSVSDGLQYLVDKMKEYMANGAQLGWLIDSFDEKVHVFRIDGTVEIKQINEILSDEQILPGFSIDLTEFLE
ncbi:Endonuclease, Uma2 family (restriction endonuclease fold) [Dyadobacter sp. SG02]|uniref:Uma2 family endonuclease n=1 Tax=Dyadobacter sp. SG02 TaxID=1855291 RepID=UPI0008AFC205|nr:Uma2 family endonuclease [Dyadobacter sp. SG02]SEI69829.1 Endonuclease, Uma2 family (restriction endonuclease fold) [Dyadobacter sp. SG02]